MALIKTTNPNPIVTQQNRNHDLVKKIKNDISEINEIYDVAVVEGKEDILVAYKVKHLQRFNMKKIEKEVNEKLEKEYPKENFTVSSDYKIFLEAVRLNEKRESGHLSSNQAEDRLNEILKMTSDMK